MQTQTSETTEQDIAELVRRFYQRAASDERLKGIFDSVIDDWEAHHRIVEDFWSRTLLGSDRYRGSPYPVHARLPLKLEDFDIWLDYFRQTALEVLPAAAAERAIARAEHMAESFKVGMFLHYNPVQTASCLKPGD
ncbi:group III truncated hemoglobin [Methylomonas koyamae]|uniref:Globin family protein n=1 Tax=Methylomonas koyamae TaxID=702114 RepID=A0A291IMS9_9GAMM|nr:group III truncated hemoglobin [Methylomonas koyamae]ATG91490.1 globin family protein [Methylomonas koyamae]OAI26878.1 globin family protein [Methylomonas koyamae]